ncbi:hypothetical protein [Alicyclobacillus sp. SP_1]|nr:hypothetical protein [Alicyclobacillus sp. SP_1]
MKTSVAWLTAGLLALCLAMQGCGTKHSSGDEQSFPEGRPLASMVHLHGR